MSVYNYKKTAGFSLIEVLIYVFILVIISAVVASTFLGLNRVLLRNKIERELTKSAAVALETMVRSVREAVTVDGGASTLGTSPGVLVVDSIATTTRFYMSSDKVYVEINGSTVGPLTTDETEVTDLSFIHYEGSGTEVETELVRISLTLSVNSKAASTTKTFYTSAVLRGSYE